MDPTKDARLASTPNRGHRVKLPQYLIHHGYASSNKTARRLITSSSVLVHGVVTTSSASMVSRQNTGAVEVLQHGRSSMSTNNSNNNTPTPPMCIVHYKICGTICTMAADESSSSSCTLVDIAPPIPPHFHPVGRLDQHSHGLLLFSASGAFTSALLSPKSKVVRVYQLVVQGDVGSVGSETYRSIVDRIAKGVETDYGSFKGTVVKMQRDVEKEGYVHDQCVDGKGCRNDKYQTSGACKPAGGGGTCSVLSSVSIKVAEGKRRMVRRMFAAIDLFVLDLKRIKYGDIELESSLLPGEWRYVSTKLETDWCRAVLEHWNNGARGWDKEDD